MGMIADNYHKEIARRKAASAAANANTEESSQRKNVQSANMVLFLTKKMHQMVNDDKAGDKDNKIFDDEKVKKSFDGYKTPKIGN